MVFKVSSNPILFMILWLLVKLYWVFVPYPCYCQLQSVLCCVVSDRNIFLIYILSFNVWLSLLPSGGLRYYLWIGKIHIVKLFPFQSIWLAFLLNKGEISSDSKKIPAEHFSFFFPVKNSTSKRLWAKFMFMFLKLVFLSGYLL